MTVVVGVAADDGYWVAADRSTSDGKYIEPMSEPKIYTRGQYIFGYAGNIGIGQLVAWNFKFPVTSSYEEMFTVFQNKLNAFIDGKGVDRSRFDTEDNMSVFLITAHNKVWVYNVLDGQLVPYQEVAIGSGGGAAAGSLRTSQSWTNHARRVRVAANVACDIIVSCLGPVDVLFLDNDV